MVTPKKPEAVAVEKPTPPRMKRRDLLEVSALLRRQKLDPSDDMALGLGTQYLTEKRSGETTLTFREWLDEDIPEDDEDVPEDEGSDADPT